MATGEKGFIIVCTMNLPISLSYKHSLVSVHLPIHVDLRLEEHLHRSSSKLDYHLIDFNRFYGSKPFIR